MDPATRDVSDVKHVVAAIGSSSSIEKCEKFAKENGVENAKFYDNYDGLWPCKAIDESFGQRPKRRCHLRCNSPFTPLRKRKISPQRRKTHSLRETIHRFLSSPILLTKSQRSTSENPRSPSTQEKPLPPRSSMEPLLPQIGRNPQPHFRRRPRNSASRVC